MGNRRKIELPRDCEADLVAASFEAALKQEKAYYLFDKSTDVRYHLHPMILLVDERMLTIHLDFAKGESLKKIFIKVFIAPKNGKFFQEHIGMKDKTHNLTIERIIHYFLEELKKY